MCGLYGFLHYGTERIKHLSDLTNALAEESAVRGTDAAGIAFVDKGEICIFKDSKSAYMLNLQHGDAVKALIGHTRHTTQGSEKKNYNNHPFLGKCNNTKFALAHNGVLANETALKRKYQLPKSKIETDSYAAVQLIEHKKQLNLRSIQFMAEAVEGSFSFSILDSKSVLWLVKGDSPLYILHFPKRKLYVYASTEKILWRALIETDLLNDLKGGKHEEISIANGDILRIQPNGDVVRDKFRYTDYVGFCQCKWWTYESVDSTPCYIDDLKAAAAYQGVDSDTIDELLNGGFTPDEIEEYIYCCE